MVCYIANLPEVIFLFKYLTSKIIVFTIAAVISCTLFLSIFSYISIKRIVSSEVMRLSIQYNAQVYKNILLYLNLMEQISKLVSQSPEVKYTLEKNKFPSNIINVMDGIQAFNANVVGIAVYACDGRIYPSNTTSNVPSFKILNENGLVRSFVNSEKESMWLYRYGDLQEFYDFQYRKYGTFTYISKIRSSNRVLLGYLVMDTKIQSLFNFFENRKPLVPGHQNVYIIRGNESLVSLPDNDPSRESIQEYSAFLKTKKEGVYFSENKRYIISVNQILDSNCKIVTIISMGSFQLMLTQLIAFLIIFVLIFSILSFLAGIVLSRSISIPLTDLYKKMTKPTLDRENELH